MTTISVLMSTFNGEKYVAKQIDSVLSQVGDFDLKLYIRDDCSSDSTLEIIDKYAKVYHDKIFVFKGKNLKLNNSFFYLLSNCPKSDYYAFCDQDDVWENDKISIALEELKKEKDDVPLLYASVSKLAHDDLVPYGTTRKKRKELCFYNTIIQNICPGHTQVFNNSLRDLIVSKTIPSEIYVYDSWVANVASLCGKIVFDNRAHTFYRQHDGQSLGYGNGYVGRIKSTYRHFLNDKNRFIAQIKSFSNCYNEDIFKRGYEKEITKFLKEKNFFQRLGYSFSCKLYRQSFLETILFKILILFNCFKTSDK